jgi:dienelactone hydrolase
VIKRLLLILLLPLGASACINDYLHSPYAVHTPLPREVAPPPAGNDVTHLRDPLDVRNNVLHHKETDRYRLRHLKFPSSGNNGQKYQRIEIWYYENKAPGRKKLVIVMPIWGSYTFPPATVTRTLLAHANDDTNVAYVLGEDYLLDWDGMAKAATYAEFERAMLGAVNRFQTAVVDVRRFIDWATERPDVDPARIGIVGFSMSAVVAGLAAVVDPRIRTTVLVMGGAHPHEILAACDARPEMVREAIRARFGWDQARYQQELERFTGPIDVARHPIRVDPARAADRRAS